MKISLLKISDPNENTDINEPNHFNHYQHINIVYSVYTILICNYYYIYSSESN